MGYPNVMKEIGSATIGLPVAALAAERAFTPFISMPKFMPDAFPGLGAIVALTGLSLAVWAGHHLWKAGGISLNLNLIWKGHTSNPKSLVTHGPYSFMRNPLVLGDMLFLVGVSLVFNSLLLLLLVAAWWGVSHHKITHREEEGLLRRFGPAYLAYQARVSRWLPKLPTRGPVSEHVHSASTC